MSPGRESPLESELEDFAEILRTEDANGVPVIVGGQAAGLWELDLLAVWPLDELRMSGNDKVSRWLQHRFPQNPA